MFLIKLEPVSLGRPHSLNKAMLPPYNTLWDRELRGSLCCDLMALKTQQAFPQLTCLCWCSVTVVKSCLKNHTSGLILKGMQVITLL